MFIMDFESFSGKTVLTFFGCFCPPHRGHYETLERAIRDVRPNIVVVESMNSDNPEYSRHGIPLSFALKTWMRWSEFLSQKYGITFYAVDNSSKFWFRTHPQRVISIETIEDENSLVEEGLRSLSRKGLSTVYWKNALNLETYSVKRDFTFSATKFTALLREQNIEKCLDFVPLDLNHEEKMEYINTMLNDYGKYLK